MRAALTLALALAACATTPAADAPLPAFPTYPREAVGVEGRIYLLALGYGQLEQRGRCLGIGHPNAEFRTIVWPYTARLGRDRHGLYVTDSESGAIIRLGDWFSFGGGGDSPPEGSPGFGEPLSEPIPHECGARVATINPGFEKSRRPR